MRKEELFQRIDEEREELWSMADQIFDNPEYEGEEVFAAGLLTDYLRKNGFSVEMGVGGYKTAFRAVSTATEKAVRLSESSVSMMRFGDWATDAATICRGLAVWALRLLLKIWIRIVPSRLWCMELRRRKHWAPNAI